MIVTIDTRNWIFFVYFHLSTGLAASAAVSSGIQIHISNDNTLTSGNSGTNDNGKANALHLQSKKISQSASYLESVSQWVI